MILELAGIRIKVVSPHLKVLEPALRPYCAAGGDRTALLGISEANGASPTNTDTGPLTVEVTAADVAAEAECVKKLGLDATNLECEFTALYKKILERVIEQDVIYLHGSALAVDGNAYIFSAPSGTGKSTHARLWREQFGDKVLMINDDKPLIKVDESGIWACGNPWNGKSALGCNVMVPLKAIVRLKRGGQNTITALNRQEALRLLYLSTYRFGDAHKVQRMLKVLVTVLERVHFFDLTCNMEPEAAIAVYEKLCILK